MPVEIQEEAEGKIFAIRLSEKLTKQDYEHFVPETERRIKQHGKLRMLVEMHDFHGWTLGALWEDIKFDLRHFADIERLALVGEKKWEAGMAAFCKPFTRATVRYFDAAQRDDAIAWLHEDVHQTT